MPRTITLTSIFIKSWPFFNLEFKVIVCVQASTSLKISYYLYITALKLCTVVHHHIPSVYAKNLISIFHFDQIMSLLTSLCASWYKHISSIILILQLWNCVYLLTIISRIWIARTISTYLAFYLMMTPFHFLNLEMKVILCMQAHNSKNNFYTIIWQLWNFVYLFTCLNLEG